MSALQPRESHSDPSKDVNDLQSARVGTKCVVCNRPAVDGNLLVNGAAYHEECHQELQQNIRQHDQKEVAIRMELFRVQKKLSEVHSFWYKLSALLGSSRIDPTALRKHEDELSAELKTTKEHRETLRRTLNTLYDYWPTYPPDWDERTAALRKLAYCRECGREKPRTRGSAKRTLFHVDHILSISQGGSHRESNLQLLCERCHQEKHNVNGFRYDLDIERAKNSAFSRRIRLLRDAIAEGRNVRFGYRKFDGERSTRTIKPFALEQVGHTLCVRGWCYLRQAERVFAVKRMRNLKLHG